MRTHTLLGLPLILASSVIVAAPLRLDVTGAVTSGSDEWLDLLGQQVTASFFYEGTTAPTTSTANSVVQSAAYTNAILQLGLDVAGTAGSAFAVSSDVVANSVQISDYNAGLFSPSLLLDTLDMRVQVAPTIQTVIPDPGPCGGDRGSGLPPCNDQIITSENPGAFEFRDLRLKAVEFNQTFLVGVLNSSALLGEGSRTGPGVLSLLFESVDGTQRALYVGIAGQPITSTVGTVVPLPSTVWLLTTAMAGALLRSIRRRGTARASSMP